MTFPNQLLIGGRWQDSLHNKQTFDSIDPSTGKLLTKVASAGKYDVEAAVKASKEAFATWNAIPRFDRGQIISKFGDNLMAHKDEIVALECNDHGKPVFQASMDLDFSVKIIKHYAGKCDKITGTSFQREAG